MKVLWSSIYYKNKGNYFEGKTWVLYKLITKTSGIRNHSFAHFCHDSNVRHFYPQNHKFQFDIKRGS